MCCIAAAFHFGKCVPLLMVVVTDQFSCRTWLQLLSMLNRLWPVPRPYYKLVRRYRLVDTFLCNFFSYSAYCSSLCAFTSFSIRKKCFTVHSKVAYMQMGIHKPRKSALNNIYLKSFILFFSLVSCKTHA